MLRALLVTKFHNTTILKVIFLIDKIKLFPIGISQGKYILKKLKWQK